MIYNYEVQFEQRKKQIKLKLLHGMSFVSKVLLIQFNMNNEFSLDNSFYL